MSSFASLRGHLLVAAPDLLDPNFRRSVVLLTEHDAEAAMGVVLNRRLEVAVADAVPALAELVEEGAQLYQGGPVQTGSVLALADFHEPSLSAGLAFGSVGYLRGDEDPTALVGDVGSGAGLLRLQRLGPGPARGGARPGRVDHAAGPARRRVRRAGRALEPRPGAEGRPLSDRRADARRPVGELMQRPRRATLMASPPTRRVAVARTQEAVRRSTVRLAFGQAVVSATIPLGRDVRHASRRATCPTTSAWPARWWRPQMLAGAAALVVAGRVSDRYGRRPALAGGFTLLALGAGVIGVAVAVGSYALLMAGAIVFGLGAQPALMGRAAAADLYPSALRARGVGLVASAGVFGAISGPLLASGAVALGPLVGRRRPRAAVAGRDPDLPRRGRRDLVDPSRPEGRRRRPRALVARDGRPAGPGSRGARRAGSCWRSRRRGGRCSRPWRRRPRCSA